MTKVNKTWSAPMTVFHAPVFHTMNIAFVRYPRIQMHAKQKSAKVEIISVSLFQLPGLNEQSLINQFLFIS